VNNSDADFPTPRIDGYWQLEEKRVEQWNDSMKCGGGIRPQEEVLVVTDGSFNFYHYPYMLISKSRYRQKDSVITYSDGGIIFEYYIDLINQDTLKLTYETRTWDDYCGKSINKSSYTYSKFKADKEIIKELKAEKFNHEELRKKWTFKSAHIDFNIFNREAIFLNQEIEIDSLSFKPEPIIDLTILSNMTIDKSILSFKNNVYEIAYLAENTLMLRPFQLCQCAELCLLYEIDN